MHLKKKEVLSMNTVAEIRMLRPIHMRECGTNLSQSEMTHILKVLDALWLHDGDPRRPHAELTSGKCSDGFVDVLRALRYTNVNRVFADQLAQRLVSTFKDQAEGIDWVVGSDHAGAVFSYAVATHFNAQHDFTEKGPNRTQLWSRFAIRPDEVVLQIEELITTSGTVTAVRDGILKGNPVQPVTFAPMVGVLVNRSPLKEIHGRPIVALVNYDIKTWEPSDCPLCAQGSKRLKPKQNWAELIGQG